MPGGCDNAGVMTDTETGPTRTVQLNGFDYWPASASRIEGLGGQVVDANPAYAFHTKYVELGQGIVSCTLRFTNLQATIGLLSIAVFGIPPVPGAQAEAVRNWTASLAEIAEGEGVVELSFQASAGSRYAVLGQIFSETDARASALELTLVTKLEATGDQRAATRKSVFGRRVFRRATRMFRAEPPTLADPVSQACTAAQFGEAAYRRWLGELRLAAGRQRRAWEQVYILQALSRYGMLRPGARGLGFATAEQRLPAVMASHGCGVVATDWVGGSAPTSARSIEALRYPEICADEVFDRQVSHRMIDAAAIPTDLNGFDFLWSTGAVEHLGSIEQGLTFMREAVACLTYGGLAVHTTAFNVGSNDETIDHNETVLFRKRDLEKLAIDLVSRGHYVAQFNYDLGSTALDKPVDASPSDDGESPKTTLAGFVTTAFGIIVRRGER